MGVIGRRMGVRALGAGILVSLLAPACGGSEKGGETQEARTMQGQRTLLLPEETTGLIDYARAGLTHLPSDMGPEEAVFPHVALVPGAGGWFVDPGPDLASWRLLRFDQQGNPLTALALAGVLELESPNEFLPGALRASADGGLSLVGSRRFNFEKGAPGDFVLARFDASGAAAPVVALPDFAPDQKLLVMGDRVLSHAAMSDGAWRVSVAAAAPETAPATPGRTPTVVVGDRVLNLVSATELRVVQGEEEGGTFAIDAPVLGTIPVSGDGRIFGFITTRMGGPGEDGITLEDRALDVLSLQPDGSVSLLGHVMLPPNRFFEEAPAAGFKLHRPGESRFDARGSYYDLEWSATSVRLYRLEAAP